MKHSAKPDKKVFSLRDSLTNYAPTRGIALILAVGMLAYGIWVLLPTVSFIGPVFDLMAHLAAEPTWGGLFTFAGLTMAYGVWRSNIEWLKRGAFLGFALWALIAVLGVIAEPFATVVITRAIIAVMHAWVYVQVAVHPGLITGEITIPDLVEYVKAKNN